MSRVYLGVLGFQGLQRPQGAYGRLVLHGDVTGGNVLLKSIGAGPQAFKV